MSKSISEKNLHALLDRLITGGARVVGPKRAGTMTLYEPLAAGNELTLAELPRRSSKETFFPVCEPILAYAKEEGKMTVTDVDLSALPETVLIAARPCDAAAPGILDAVFSWDYHDAFYLERRRKATIIGVACTSADDACFCTAVGLNPGERQGSDLFLAPLQGGGFAAEAVTAKGETLLSAHADLFAAGDGTALPLATPGAAPLDLGRIKTWLDANFEHPLWNQYAEICAGCGACAFLCPACHCFDISDEGSELKGERRKHWDACGFGKFSLHASAHNPRDVQPQRYRNRIMHKFKYYRDKFDQTLCTGCGRCIRVCPVGIDIKEILDEINSK
ncbi:MAG TPA: heterodisulfide reductase subunit A [Desulfuromonas sp.]|nr:heterodisulfide reductase subunit A [Desulfuromonas sp.]